MKLCINKEIKKLRCVIRRLFKKKEFCFNRENFLDYTFFHENGLFSKVQAIRKLIADWICYNGSYFENCDSLSILDVGCGTGEIGELLQYDFNKIVGVDSSVETVRKATARNLKNSRFLACRAESLCFANGVFDVVILVNILHHSSKWIRIIIYESYRVLKKGGLMVIFELNPLNPLQMIWFYLFSPIDRGMHMISPMYLKRIVKEVRDDDNLMIVKHLLSSLYFEYMTVYSKNN